MERGKNLIYEDLKDFDILTPRVVSMIRGGPFKIKGGKIVQELPVGFEPETPWIFQPGDEKRSCRRWNVVYFQLYGIIPRGCFNCWKVVTRPKSLSDLFKIRSVQRDLGIAGKCGLEERRASSHKGLYAAFWYCPMGGGLEGARETHRKVEYAVHKAIGMQNRVILKRACTEMEDGAGPSDKWVFPPIQHRVENYLDNIWEIEEESTQQPSFLKIHIMKRWIEYAWENRDETVREFVQNPELSFGLVPTTTYQEGSTATPEQPAVEVERKDIGPNLQRLQDYL